MVLLFFAGFVIAKLFWNFGYGLARSKFRVRIWHGNEEDQGVLVKEHLQSALELLRRRMENP